MNRNILICFALIAFPSLIKAQSSCHKHKNCGECITDASVVCVWCNSIDPKYDKEERCVPKESLDPTWCSGYLDLPENESINVAINKNFSSTTDEVVQIRPQEYDLKIRPGQPLNFPFSFKGASNYPVDLYILLDASLNMKDLKDTISNHSKIIFETMQNLTTNVYIGFGSYVEKRMAPYTLILDNNSTVYSFKHRVNLTSNYSEFQNAVDSIKFGANVDEPDSGFEALAQVLACNMGWRDISRKILLLITEKPQHVVGDGRSAGIFKPFDGKCYTNVDGYYTNELEMDYPSLAKINNLALKRQVTIIFTLKSNKYQPFYDNLKSVIRNSKVAILQNNNIVEQLKESYLEISRNIKLEVEVKSGHRKNYDITFKPDCTGSNKKEECIVFTENILNFTGFITLNEYYKKDNEAIEVSVQGINEKLIINLDVIKCSCEVEKKISNSSHCHGQTLQCGICSCDSTRNGIRCMCETGQVNTGDDFCVGPSSNNSLLCSGNGECQCGLCTECYEYRFGSYCECDRRRCPGFEESSGVECGGHGKCSCSGVTKETCSCNKGWSYKPGAEYLGCVCPTDVKDSCINKHFNTVCSNRGLCTCGSCVCDPIAQWDKRTEQCPLCQMKPNPDRHSQQCNVITTCISCRKNSDNCDKECDGIVLEHKYDDLPEEYLNSKNWSLCDQQKVDMGCYTKFVYQYDDMHYKILLKMEDKNNCAENYYKYGGILLLTLLLVGIFTILAWKVFTWLQDRKEYAKFEAEHKNVLNRASVNPLYDGPTTTFRNPAFKKSCHN